MTLVVSLRVLDGVVLAADSLATLISRLEIGHAAELDCPNCKNRVLIDDLYQHAKAFPPCPSCQQTIEVPQITRPMMQTASSTLSFSQKVLPFLGTFGIGVFGAAAVGQKTLYNHLKGLERSLREEMQVDPARAAQLSTVTGVADAVNGFCITIFDQAFSPPPPDLPELVFGLQIVGYDSPQDAAPTTMELRFGKQHAVTRHQGLGITFSGDTRFPVQLWRSCEAVGLRPTVENLSLQDAVDYADFQVSTTATVQRFANMIPTVGGEVDIALITNYSEFRWIRSKRLARVLEPRYTTQPTDLQM